MDGVGFRKKLTTNGDLTERNLKKYKKVLDKSFCRCYNIIRKKEREVLKMKKTIVTGINQYGDVIARVETTYEKRFEVINQVMDMEEVTAVTTTTIIKRA